MPYFGKWPEWIELYLRSCSFNNFIDFHFFTDCCIPNCAYENTIFHSISWENYQKLISERLCINYQRQSAYALCDVRPFYGFIHKKLLQNYDFWGFGDIDVCYGNLSNFINTKTLNSKNVISMHADRISGHFALFRNSEHFRNLCFSIPNWKEKLQSTKQYGMDEHDLTCLVFPGIKNIHRLYRHLCSKFVKDYRTGYKLLIWPINLFTKLSFVERYTCPVPKKGDKWKYDLFSSKLLSPSKKEIPYIHFLFFKKTSFYDTDNYWHTGFYKLSTSQVRENNGSVIFDINGIWYQDD